MIESSTSTVSGTQARTTSSSLSRLADSTIVRRVVPITGGIVGLALAGYGEMLVEAKEGTQLSLAVYLAGILLFAASAWPLTRTQVDMPVDAPAQEKAEAIARRRARYALIGGLALAVLMN